MTHRRDVSLRDIVQRVEKYGFAISTDAIRRLSDDVRQSTHCRLKRSTAATMKAIRWSST